MAERSCSFSPSTAPTEKQLTVSGSVCRKDIQWLLCIRGLLPCAILSQVHRCGMCGIVGCRPDTGAAAGVSASFLSSTCWVPVGRKHTEDTSHKRWLHTPLFTLNGTLAKVQSKIFCHINSHHFIPLWILLSPLTLFLFITSAFPRC